MTRLPIFEALYYSFEKVAKLATILEERKQFWSWPMTYMILYHHLFLSDFLHWVKVDFEEFMGRYGEEESTR